MRRLLDVTSRPPWRWVIGLVLVAHGAIHLLGVWWAFDLGEIEGLGGPTLLVTGQAPGDPAVIAFGLLWLVATIGFIAAGVAVAFGSSRGMQVTAFAAAVSLIPTVVWWNDAWIGAVFSAVLLLLFVAASRERLDSRETPEMT